MNEIKIFESETFGKIRVTEINSEPWWVLVDVCKALEIGNSRMVANRLDKDELMSIKLTSGGQKREMTVINESGLYAVILRSDKPQAKSFRKWITSEVIPSIRKNGTYGEADYSSLSPQLQFMIKMEQRQNRLERRIDSMCETMQVRGSNWRKATHSLINRISSASGIEQRELYLVIYDELELRAGVDLDRRLANLEDRLYERGVSESRISRLNYIDVIAEDRKLIEIYIAIVKETAIKYNAE